MVNTMPTGASKNRKFRRCCAFIFAASPRAMPRRPSKIPADRAPPGQVGLEELARMVLNFLLVARLLRVEHREHGVAQRILGLAHQHIALPRLQIGATRRPRRDVQDGFTVSPGTGGGGKRQIERREVMA